MANRRSVLIVDSLEETRAVLQTALAQRGVRTLAASRRSEGLALARRHHPDLIVLDLDVAAGSAEGGRQAAVESEFAFAGSEGPTPLVLLGTARRRGAPASGGEFVAKPYHYAPLIRKIEALLEAAG